MTTMKSTMKLGSSVTNIARALARAGALALVGAALAPAPAHAQNSAAGPELLLAVADDGVLIHLVEAPPRTGGFVVSRAAPGGAAVRLTAEPIRPFRDPALAAAHLGPDRDLVAEAVGAPDHLAILRRLEADPMAGNLISLLVPRAAELLGRAFLDTTAAPGAEYEYRIAYTDREGKETGRTARARIRVAPTTPPAPSGVTAEAGDRSVTIRWEFPQYRGDPRDVVVGFHIYRTERTTGAAGAPAAGQPPIRLTRVPILRNDAAPRIFHDGEAANDVAYHYELRAVDLAGREGAAARSPLVTPRDRTAPAIPQELTTEPGDGFVRLTWRLNTEPDLAGYFVERSLGLELPFKRLNTEPLRPFEPFWTDRTALGGTPYFYRIVAIDRSGNESRPGNAIAALPFDRTPPAPPAGTTAAARERRLEIRWRPSPSADVKGYYIYRGENRTGLVRLVEQPIAATTFADSGFASDGLLPGARYTIAISAVDHAYNEAELDFAEVAIPDDEPPRPPTGLIVENVHGRYAEIRWSPSPSLDVGEYLLTRRGEGTGTGGGAGGAGGAAVTIGRAPLGGVGSAHPASLRDTTLVRGERYTYSLIAIDTAGNASAAATAAFHFTEAVPPPAPRHAAAAPRAGGAGNEIRWERVVDKELAGYHVYRALVPTGTYERLTTEPVAGISFVDPQGLPEHYYRVRAVDRSGNLSAPSPSTRAGQ
jgi:fibronectin type 3 domain-containing protein